MVKFWGSGRANFNMNNSLFLDHFESYINSSSYEIPKLAPEAMEFNEISKIF